MANWVWCDMRINEVTDHIQNLPSSKDKHVYIAPVRTLGTCTIQSDTVPKKAHVEVNGQVMGNKNSDIEFEVVGNGEIIAMAECFGNLVVNARDADELEALVKKAKPHLHTPVGDFTLSKGRTEVIGNIVRVDFQEKSVKVKIDRTGQIHAH